MVMSGWRVKWNESPLQLSDTENFMALWVTSWRVVWKFFFLRLILFCFYCKSQVIPLQIPCKSHFSPIIGNGLGTDLQRTWNGGEAKGGHIGAWKQKKRYSKVSLFALQDGLEPTTPWLTVMCSNQLSYWSSFMLQSALFLNCDAKVHRFSETTKLFSRNLKKKLKKVYFLRFCILSPGSYMLL